MSRRRSGVGKFVAGALVGVGLGVLFAPKSGEETRKELKAKWDELVAKIKELDVQEVKQSLLNKIEEIKLEISELDKEKVAAAAKKKAAQIKAKLDSLYEEAKAKATPAVEKAVDDLRNKTVRVLKSTIKSSSLKSLIDKGIVIEEKYEINREVKFNSEK